MKWSLVCVGLLLIASVCECQDATGLLDEKVDGIEKTTENSESSNANPNTPDAKTSPEASNSTASINTTVTAEPTTANTTVNPNTTTTASTTVNPNTTTAFTTVSPNTTTSTVSPNTTTTSTTASPNTTTSTTANPNTTTTAIPPTTTTAAPPPKPAEYQKYVVRDGNKTCIIAKMAAEIVLHMDNKTTTLVLPGNRSETDLNGTCGPEEQVLSVAWDVLNETNTITFTFAQNGSKFFIKEVEATLIVNNETEVLRSSAKPLFETPVNNSYRCMHEQSVNLTGTENMNATLKVSQVQLEAFHSDGSTEKFSSAIDCEPGDVSDIVPIAVGCALAGLVVIVLIAYLIGRRRSRTRGYLSM